MEVLDLLHHLVISGTRSLRLDATTTACIVAVLVLVEHVLVDPEVALRMHVYCNVLLRERDHQALRLVTVDIVIDEAHEDLSVDLLVAAHPEELLLALIHLDHSLTS